MAPKSEQDVVMECLQNQSTKEDILGQLQRIRDDSKASTGIMYGGHGKRWRKRPTMVRVSVPKSAMSHTRLSQTLYPANAQYQISLSLPAIYVLHHSALWNSKLGLLQIEHRTQHLGLLIHARTLLLQILQQTVPSANMPTTTTGFLHSTLMSAMVEAKKEAKNSNDAFTAQESAMTQAWQSNLTAYLAHKEAPTTTLPASPPHSPPSPAYPETPAKPPTTQQNLDSELRKLNVELENCQLTREALSRRETALHQRKSEIERLCTCAAPAPKLTRGQDEDRDDGGDNDKYEALYVRNVGRRSKMCVARIYVVRQTGMQEEVKRKGKDKKVTVEEEIVV
jgi:hypothetical protein